jgi:single-strand DNA-binding protein
MGANRIHLMGNIGADAELRSANGGDVCKLRLAVNEKWKDAGGERRERTDWFSVVIFGKRASALAQHLTKGTQIYVSGKMRSNEWEKDGVKRTSWDVIADEVEFAGGGKREGGERQQPREQHRTTDTRQAAPQDNFDDSDIPW